MTLNDGGPAFPAAALTGKYHETVQAWSGGMTLRDYFAAAALTGIFVTDPHNEFGAKTAATMAYQYADAMLAERDK